MREFPSVDSPVITVSTNYRGASADVIESQITEPLEESVNGIAGMVAIVCFGYLLDYLTRGAPNGQIRGFGLIFISAVLCGMISLGFLQRITDPFKTVSRHYCIPLWKWRPTIK